ncbi:MAG: trimethylamine methyltransferase family protein [Desulfosudis oleivorans]|nr:trimethylamine methyltransferase family protein [Desulfosudis oleivorans]
MTQIVPRISVLSAASVAEVHARSLEILSEIGVRVDSPRTRKLLASAAGVVSGDGPVRLPAELVAWALAAAPSNVAVFKRTGEPAFTLGPNAGGARFGIGVTNLFYQDPLTDEVVPFSRGHMASCARLGDALPAFDVVSTIGVLRDLAPDVADLYATLEMAANTTKSLVLLVSEAAAFEPALDMLESLCGEPVGPPVRPPVRQSRLAARHQRGDERQDGRVDRPRPPGHLFQLWHVGGDRAHHVRGDARPPERGAARRPGAGPADARGGARHSRQPARRLRHGHGGELLRARDHVPEPGQRRDDGPLPAAALRHLRQRRGLGRRPPGRGPLLDEPSDLVPGPGRPGPVRRRELRFPGLLAGRGRVRGPRHPHVPTLRRRVRPGRGVPGTSGDRGGRAGRRLPRRRLDPEAFPRGGVPKPRLPAIEPGGLAGSRQPASGGSPAQAYRGADGLTPAPPDHDDLLAVGETRIARRGR